MTTTCERCTRHGDRTRLRTTDSVVLGRPVTVCRFDDECKPQDRPSQRQPVVEVMDLGGDQAQLVRLEQSNGRTRTRSKSEPAALGTVIEEAAWLALCLAWRRQQPVLLRLRLHPASGQLDIKTELAVPVPDRLPEVT